MEVGKTLRAHGAHGPSYSETSSRTPSYVPGAKDERSQLASAHEEAVASALAPLDREHAILHAWIAADSGVSDTKSQNVSCAVAS